MMAILAFEPERFEELKQRMHEGRVELCNAFFLEPSISLSGGEALVKSGVEGLRWQQKVMGVRPRLAWMIDVCGVHEQMGQIVSGLGLDAMMYCRYNPTDSIPHWQQSPDGSRILAMANDTYADFDPVFATQTPLKPEQFETLADNIDGKAETTPERHADLRAGWLRRLFDPAAIQRLYPRIRREVEFAGAEGADQFQRPEQVPRRHPAADQVGQGAASHEQERHALRMDVVLE